MPSGVPIGNDEAKTGIILSHVKKRYPFPRQCDKWSTMDPVLDCEERLVA